MLSDNLIRYYIQTSHHPYSTTVYQINDLFTEEEQKIIDSKKKMGAIIDQYYSAKQDVAADKKIHEDILGTATQLFYHNEITHQSLVNTPNEEMVKTAIYIHTLAMRVTSTDQNKLSSPLLIKKREKKSTIGLQHSLITDLTQNEAYLIPAKNDSWVIKETNGCIERGGLKVDYNSNDVEEIAILTAPKNNRFPERIKKYLHMFKVFPGHVRVHDIFKRHSNKNNQEPKIYVCTDYYAHSLSTIPLEKVTCWQLISFIKDLTLGLSLSHSCGVIHNNIRLETVLIKDRKIDLKKPGGTELHLYTSALGDWNKAYDGLTPTKIDYQFYGAIENTAPELINKPSRIVDIMTVDNERSHDVYALGRTLLSFIFRDEREQLESTPHMIVPNSSARNEFIKNKTLSERLKWYQLNKSRLTNKENELIVNDLLLNYSHYYLYAKKLIESRLSNKQYTPLRNILLNVVEMVNPLVDKRPTCKQLCSIFRDLEKQ